MRNKKWNEMTDEEKRIAIAELCGWVIDKGDPPYTFGPYWKKDGKRVPIPEHLPDYLNDLNAMHEAEKVLGKLEDIYNGLHDASFRWYTYRCSLDTVISRKPHHDQYYSFINASAEERAEAFYNTMIIGHHTSIQVEDGREVDHENDAYIDKDEK